MAAEILNIVFNMPERCHAYFAASGGGTPNLEGKKIKFKGSLIFGSAYIKETRSVTMNIFRKKIFSF